MPRLKTGAYDANLHPQEECSQPRYDVERRIAEHTERVAREEAQRRAERMAWLRRNGIPITIATMDYL